MMPRALKLVLRVLLPVVVVAGGVYGAKKIYDSRSRPKRRARPQAMLHVEVKPLTPTDYRIWLRSRGTVSATTRTRLAAELAGRVTRISHAFQDGGFFFKGDLLVEIDRRDHDLEVRRLTQELEQAKASLGELVVETASNTEQVALAVKQHELAIKHLQRIGKLSGKGVSSDSAVEESKQAELNSRIRLVTLRNQGRLLVARKTRLEAQQKLIEVRLESARLELGRTRITAPYDGRVLTRQVDVGQYVSRGTALATIYAVDAAEVRLPLSDQQLAQAELPVQYVDGKKQLGPQPEVTLTVGRGHGEHRWKGRIVRTEGAIDERTRQLYVIARVEGPYAKREDGQPPLRVGSFVRAEIAGRQLKGVYVVPRAWLHEETGLLVLDATGTRLRRQPVVVRWRDGERVVLEQTPQLPAGTRVCVTPVVFAGDSVTVRVGGKTGRGKRGKRP